MILEVQTVEIYALPRRQGTAIHMGRLILDPNQRFEDDRIVLTVAQALQVGVMKTLAELERPLAQDGVFVVDSEGFRYFVKNPSVNTDRKD